MRDRAALLPFPRKSPMKAIAVPATIHEALSRGATLAISISGGRDSQAILRQLTAFHREHGFPGRLYALHADLGRAEWPQTASHCERICHEVDVPLVVVRRAKGDLFARFEERAAAVAGTATPWAPDSKNRYCTSHLKSAVADQYLRKDLPPPSVPVPWAPSSDNRYCTSDLKRGPSDQALRANQLVVNAMGLRAKESADRARRPRFAIRKSITTKALTRLLPKRGAPAAELEYVAEQAFALWDGTGRLAFDWHPIHHWDDESVWEACGTSSVDLERRRQAYREGQVEAAFDGWPCHPAYVLGNARLSCAMCFMASRRDLQNGARYNPEAYQFLVQLEERTGSTFRHGERLRDLFEDRESLAVQRGQASLFSCAAA